MVAFGRDALVERLPGELEEIDRIASVPVTERDRRRRRAAARVGAVPGRDAEADRARQRRQRHDRARPVGGRAGGGARRAHRDVRRWAWAAPTRSSSSAWTRPRRRAWARRSRPRSPSPRPSRQPATVRLFGDGAQIGVAAGRSSSPGLTRVVFTDHGDRGRLPHLPGASSRPSSDTFGQNDRGGLGHDRQGRPAHPARGRVDAEVAAQPRGRARGGAPGRGRRDRPTACPRTSPSSPATTRSCSWTCPRTRLGTERMDALQVYVRDVGRGLVMIGGHDSYGAGGYARTPLEETLPVEMDVRDRDDAAGHRAGRGHRRVGLHGRLPLQHRQPRPGRGDRGRAQGGHRQGGHPARRGRPDASATSSAWWPSTRTRTGSSTPRRWASVGDVEAQIAGIKADGQTNIFAGLSAAVDSLEDDERASAATSCCSPTAGPAAASTPRCWSA